MQNIKSLSPEEDLDMDMLVETELSRLNRQYRIMEGDRKAFFEEMNTKLVKQRAIIQTLRNEKNQLLTDLKVATSASKKRHIRVISAKINKMYSQYETYLQVIDKERHELKETNEQIRKLEKKIDNLRGNDVTENQFKVRVQSGKKAIELLENKLQTSIKRFCTTLSDNKTLREELDHLLKERTNFNTIWESLLQKLAEGKKTMLYIIEEATSAYDTREEWCAKLHALKIRAKNDEILHTQDLREMNRIMDHDEKLKEFLCVKGQKRIMKELELKEQLKKETMIKNEEKQTEIYEATLKQIQEFCQEDNTDRIAAKYLKQEEENFALFNYVNELQQELENLKNELEVIEDKLNQMTNVEDTDSKDQHANMKIIDQILDDAKKEAEEAEVVMKEAHEKLENIMIGILDVFKILECEGVPILELIGDNTNINSNNVMIYLGLIEKRISELITLAFLTDPSVFPDEEY
ncbi:hypothetical protein WA026_019785 [Henosepilachna vigintioctopunctata]|uniref:ODAD1 central coiled coil region domain-containing protein n=1 Tax=Henosepilachna vigintioctopunctata TaxID=420089 RepID=A0AAW1V9E7_9CUCU